MGNILALIGATGKKSGGILVEQISQKSEQISNMFPGGIRAITRNSSNVIILQKYIPQVNIMRGDLTNKKFLQNALEDVDTLIHLAGINWSKEIVSAAAKTGVRRLILVHTTGIYSKYKAAGEMYRQIDEYVYNTCKKYKIILTICRPTMIYGNILDNNVITFVKMVDKLPIMPVVNKAQYELQPVHYSDLGIAYCQILFNEETTANKDFILSGGSPVFLRDMLKIIGINLNKDVQFINCPFWLAFLGAWVIYCATFGKKDYREKVQRLCEPRIFSHQAATEAFGYNPMIFEEGIKDEVKEYKRLTK